MLLRPGKASLTAKPGYSLVELLVVIGVIGLLLLASLPNVFGRSDRLSLDNGAQRIRQVLVDARTRSLAPTKNDSLGTGQIFQVVFGSFANGADSFVAGGNENTNLVSMERGLAKCDSGDLQGGFVTVKNFKLQRGIFVSKFYPSNQAVSDQNAAVRFSVGKAGFECGAQNNPTISSTMLNSAAWTGVYTGGSSKAVARYLVIEISSKSSSAKRYVSVDRETSEVTISDKDPQGYFQSIADTRSPRWANPNGEFPNDLRMIQTCGHDQSTVTLSFRRSEDRNASDTVTDPNLAVFYDLSWNINDETSGPDLIWRPLATKFYQDVGPGNDTVIFAFTTTEITIANQPAKVTVRVNSSDDASPNNNQVAQTPGALDLTNVDKERWRSFTPNCGQSPSDSPVKCQNENDSQRCKVDDPDDPGQGDPGGNYEACPVAQVLTDKKVASIGNLSSKQWLYYLINRHTNAAPLALIIACNGIGPEI